MLAARLGLERARGIADALGILGLPAAVLTEQGLYIAANDTFSTRLRATSLSGERLALVDPVANRYRRAGAEP